MLHGKRVQWRPPASFVTPTAADASTMITVNGQPVASGTASQSISLNQGDNVITTVASFTAQNGTTDEDPHGQMNAFNRGAARDASGYQNANY